MYKLLLVFLLSVISVVCLAGEPLVGFIWHYPFEDTYTADLEGLGATVMNSRIPWVVVEKAEGEYDFSCLDRQMALARQYGFRLILIIEFNPFCKPGWLYEKCRAAGELTAGYFGQPGADNAPSLNSPVCREAQERLVKNLTEYLAKNDRDHLVIGYEAGVEWWHNIVTRYAEPDKAGFVPWLEEKYGTADALNRAWGTEYKSIGEARIPPLDLAPNNGTGAVFAPSGEARNIAWYNAEPYPWSGDSLSFTAEVENTGVLGSGSFITVAWFKEGSLVPVAATDSAHFTEQNGRTVLSVKTRRPENAIGFSIYMLLVGSGEVRFGNIRVEGDGKPITVPPDRIVFDPRTKTPDARGEYREGAWTIGTDRQWPEPVSPAMACDYQEYWQDMSAEYINYLASLVKKYDKSRFLMSFLTMTFAYSAEWDYNVNACFLPDKVFRAGDSLDVLGMQLVGAEGDPYRIAAGMDLARKYRKPLCDIDLIDFNAGGLLPMDRVKQLLHTSVMHGADRILFCNYEGYDENAYRPYYEPEEIKSLISEARLALEAVKGYSPRPRTALINTFITPYPGMNKGYGNESRSLMGWYKLLEDRQIETDVVTFNELEYTDLDDYDTVVIPDCPYIPDKAFDALSSYRGSVICVRGAGVYDQYGNRRPMPLRCPNAVYCKDYGYEFAKGAERRKRAGDTPPMFQLGALAPSEAKAVEGGLKVLDPLQQDRIRTSRQSRVMRLYDRSGNLLVYIVNFSGEENTVENLVGAGEIITEKGRVSKPVFRSFCIIKFRRGV